MSTGESPEAEKAAASPPPSGEATDSAPGALETLGNQEALPSAGRLAEDPRLQLDQLLRRFGDGLFARSPIDSLAFFRLAFGLVMAVDCLAYLSGRAQRAFVDPVFHFSYPWTGWLSVPSPRVVYGLFWLMLACTVLLVIGRWVRPAAGVFAVAWIYLFLGDKALFNNHDYLIALLALLLAVVPTSKRAREVDAAGTAPRWGLWLLQFQIAIPYVFGALAKINGDWLVRMQPMKTWLQTGRTEGDLFFSWFGAAWAPAFFSWGGFLLDLLVVPALLYRKTRAAAFLAVVGFHLLNSQMFTIGVFPWLMIGATTLFFDPTWPRRVGFHLAQAGTQPTPRGKKPRRKRAARRPAHAPLVRAEESAPTVAEWTPRQRAVALFVGVWVLVQIALPLRHYAYRGWVDWTERGHTFAWRMKLRDKVGRVDFVLVDPVSGDFQPLQEIGAVLTERQRRMMIHDPEMIRQLAVYLRERLARAGHDDREVRVVTAISLNGRPAQQMIQPTVDLGRLPRGRPVEEWLVALQPVVPE